MRLIDKDALVAEIERRTDELWALIPDGDKVFGDKHTKEDAFNLGKYTTLESLDKFINTMEVNSTDAFIEKATLWLLSNASDYVVLHNSYDTKELVKDFVDAMKRD